ncbi:PREDICTED: 5'-3' exoribonuclease 2-like [Priapulus caudatus]|uniref:5'-3' exoribonuclease n=1 Tax=Priapulus caudatus TaxID=37621 RepID=A0ABM1EX84_PRICU|nr:PREDICTED: 5'-3' exoribonuclease 2-like [Priapulus caudatus]
MGVPAFFRWLSRKSPAIVIHCVEEKLHDVDGNSLPIDSSKPNPNDIEFDNLYLDMNGIIHPCCHPENKPAPKNEDEMMVLIFEYIDRLFRIVRPRKLLYMAIDGVAPRAKMNQQRSRRFRASKETAEKMVEVKKIRDDLRSKGASLPPEKQDTEHFDSNCITPGTPFMDRLATCLRYYIYERLNTDAGWKDIEVILSDANAPGEGEHKIMDYIRRQRANPDHDPNTKHCLCGADADLIMLGLATHEPDFTIIREEFKPNEPRPCDLCGQLGHEMKDCVGLPKEKQGEHDELSKPVGAETEFIFIRLPVLKEYLQRELRMDNLPFPYDFERAIDDWVFMCFFVGNDFLPHLPSLEIREGAIDKLVNLYKKCVYKTGGYITDSGSVSQERIQMILSELGEMEDLTFQQRQLKELEFRRRDKDKKKRMRMEKGRIEKPSFMMGGQYAPQAPGRGGTIHNPRQTATDMRSNDPQNAANKNAAAELRAMLTPAGEGAQKGTKRSHEDDEEEEPEPVDDVRLYEDGWKDRYYQSKFDVSPANIEFRHEVAAAYVRGLMWVLRYYYQGCASWTWYFPYHYAPFASDFLNVGDLKIEFETDTQPFNPMEQLMGVFPAASKQHLPVTFRRLMFAPESPIIDFYPENFYVDLNGKKYAWQGVALLPFVDEKRLLKALVDVYPDLTEDEKRRNTRGNDILFVGKDHPAHDFLEGITEGSGVTDWVPIDTKLTSGMGGIIFTDQLAICNGGTVVSPLPAEDCPDLPNNTAISVKFKDPEYPAGFIFPAKVLPGAKPPAPSLKPGDFRGANYRPITGFQRSNRGAHLDQSGHRALRHTMGGGRGQFAAVPPPVRNDQSYGRSGGYGQGGADRYQGRNYNQGANNYGNQWDRGSSSSNPQGGPRSLMGTAPSLMGMPSHPAGMVPPRYQTNQDTRWQQDSSWDRGSQGGHRGGGHHSSYSRDSNNGGSADRNRRDGQGFLWVLLL